MTEVQELRKENAQIRTENAAVRRENPKIRSELALMRNQSPVHSPPTPQIPSTPIASLSIADAPLSRQSSPPWIRHRPAHSRRTYRRTRPTHLIAPKLQAVMPPATGNSPHCPGQTLSAETPLRPDSRKKIVKPLPNSALSSLLSAPHPNQYSPCPCTSEPSAARSASCGQP